MTNQLQVPRRLTGAAGPPATMLSGQFAWNSVEQVLYFGDGDNGSGVATTIRKIAGSGAVLLVTLLGAANGVAPLDAAGKLPAANLPASIVGAQVYQGVWNAATNSPQLLSGQGTKGQFYKVSTAGIATLTAIGTAQASAANVVNLTSTTGIAVGMLATASNVPAGATVQSISGNNVTLSAATTSASAAGSSISFASYLDGTSGSNFQVGDYVGFNGTVWDKIDGPAEAVTTVSGRIGAIVLTSADLTDATNVGRSLLTAVSLAAQRVSLKIDGRTRVADTGYACGSSDFNVQMTSMTAARTITLAPAGSMNEGAQVQIGDTSGQASSTNILTITRNGSDTINGGTAITINQAYGQVTLQSDGNAKWTLMSQTAAQPSNIDGGTF